MFNSLILAFLLAVLTVPTAYAQPVPATSTSPVSYPISTFRNVNTFGAASVNPANVQRFAFAVAVDGLVVADATTGLPLPSGQTTPVTVRGNIPKASVAGAIGRFMGKTLPVLSAGVALYELGQELGFGLDNSSGPIVVTQVLPGQCTVAPCTGWSTTPTGTLYGSREAALAARFNSSCFNRAVFNGQWFWYTGPPNGTPLNSPLFALCPSAQGVFTQGSIPPSAGEPSTPQAFADAIAAKSSWPTSSALARAAKDAILSGETLEAPTTTIIGPSTTPGPISSTTDGTTTTQTTTDYTHSYVGDTVSTTIVTTNTTFNNSNGDTISSTTTTVTPDLPPASEPDPFELPCGIAGKPACEVKIDETGVPDADSAGGGFDPPGTDLTAAEESVSGPGGFISQWEAWTPGEFTFSFNLPTGCTPLPVFAGLVIDVCDYQAQFHGLMSLVWILTGVTGLFVIFNKAQ